MFRKCAILAVCVFLFGVQTAAAQTRCTMVDTVLQSFSVVQDIRLDEQGANFSTNLERLNRLTGQISLSELQPASYSADFPVESQSLSFYLATLRDAAREAASGDRDYARKRLSRGVPDNLGASLRSLEQYWNCLPSETLNSVDAEVSTKAARASQASGRAPKSAETSQAKPKAGRSEGVRGSPSISGFKTVGVSASDVFQGNSLRFIVMMLGFIAAAYFYYRRQRKKSRAREPRRIIHAPAQLQIGPAKHTMIVIDITRFGLKVQHDGKIKKTGKLQIEIDGNWHVGQVQWSNDLFAGVKLKRPIGVKAFRDYVETAQEKLALEKEALAGFV
jgi:cbb3-type cytochrome oxidase subunit 3